MKWLNLLMLSVALFLIPIASSAGLICDLLNTCSETPPAAVPEPSGALVMGIALVTVALAGRRQRR